MNKQQMLERIYEVIADKTFIPGIIMMDKSDGEKFIHAGVLGYGPLRYENHLRSIGDYKIYYCDHSYNPEDRNENTEFNYKAIGHPVMIGDVLDWIYENDIDQVELHKIIERKGKDTNFTYTPSSVMVIASWKEKRKPIDEQSDECIKFVYDLLPKE